jgi:hypothetical protein
MSAKRKTKAAKPIAPTPGPYAVVDCGHGFRIVGTLDVTIAWLSESSVYGARGSHSISLAEARANAEFLAAALTAKKRI